MKRYALGVGLALTSVVALASAQTPLPTSRPAAIGSASRPKPVRRPDASVTPAAKDLNRHADFLLRIKQGPVNLLFLGDSILDWWPKRGEFTWLKFAPYLPADFGVSADRTEHLLWRIEHGELNGIAPKVVVLMIGTNNIGIDPVDTPEQAAAGVAKVVQVVHDKLPQSKLLLLAVFPRGARDSKMRHDVERINAIIGKLDDGDRTRFVDVGHVFLDADGEIPTDVMGDRLHPTEKGYGLWYDAMGPLLDEMMK